MSKNFKSLVLGIAILFVLVCVTLVLAITGKNSAQNAASLRGPIENMRFTLYASGIYPTQTQVKAGNALIAVEDRTHNSSGIAVQRETGQGASEVGRVKTVNQSRGRALLRLEPGRYVVFDITRPANRAELLVEP
ncbi:MAG TPA: hypothetical protein VGJ69_09185 [Pyrinomonadaceae bacterium]